MLESSFNYVSLASAVIVQDRGHGGYGGNAGDQWACVASDGSLGANACFASGWYDKLAQLVFDFLNATGCVRSMRVVLLHEALRASHHYASTLSMCNAVGPDIVHYCMPPHPPAPPPLYLILIGVRVACLCLNLMARTVGDRAFLPTIHIMRAETMPSIATRSVKASFSLHCAHATYTSIKCVLHSVTCRVATNVRLKCMCSALTISILPRTGLQPDNYFMQGGQRTAVGKVAGHLRANLC